MGKNINITDMIIIGVIFLAAGALVYKVVAAKKNSPCNSAEYTRLLKNLAGVTAQESAYRLKAAEYSALLKIFSVDELLVNNAISPL